MSVTVTTQDGGLYPRLVGRSQRSFLVSQIVKTLPALHKTLV